MSSKIAQGAEAIIYSDGEVVTKDRFEKTYRHPELDKRLRQFRTRREAKVLQKLKEFGFPCPALIDLDDKEMKLHIEHIPGDKLKDVLESDAEQMLVFSKEVGELIAEMHEHDIIHSDLTTSNMIVHEKDNKIFFIDFGLSFFSDKVEDKAVDLHLLRHAIESKHYKIFERSFAEILKGYKKYKDAALVLARLEKVEARGRNKGKH